MTLAEAEEVFAYWADNPPAHLMVQTIAAMLGWKRRAVVPPAGEGLAEIATAPPAGLAVVQGARGMPPPVFDIDALRAANRARATLHDKME
ncbi:MAG TPA: hypothetical protein VGG57_02250 [Stellaceae bacterium]